MRAFAPMVILHPDERYAPMSARWFLSRSVLWLAEDDGCDDRKVAVGRLLKAQRNEVTDFMFIEALGEGPGYWRQSYYDEGCERYREEYRYYSNQLTRPYDGSPDRQPRLNPGEGYYLDLMDWGRGGPPPREVDGQARAGGAVTAWYERRREDVDGDPALRITYWLLYGMHEPVDPRGRPVAAVTHEGDWERVEVLLSGEDGEWEPRSVRLFGVDGAPRDVGWDRLRRVGGDAGASGAATHPVLFAARGSHTLYPRPGDRRLEVPVDGWASVEVEEAVAAPCPACPRWETWRRLADVTERLWYGFGGAWGDVGVNDATTGPLGPHGRWEAVVRDATPPPFDPSP